MAGDVVDDSATDIVMINGTSINDTILIGGDSGLSTRALFASMVLIHLYHARCCWQSVGRTVSSRGLAGNDTLGFYTLSAVDAGLIAAHPLPLLRSTPPRSALDRVTISPFLMETAGTTLCWAPTERDQMDGGSGSDFLYGFGGTIDCWETSEWFF